MSTGATKYYNGEGEKAGREEGMTRVFFFRGQERGGGEGAGKRVRKTLLLFTGPRGNIFFEDGTRHIYRHGSRDQIYLTLFCVEQTTMTRDTKSITFLF